MIWVEQPVGTGFSQGESTETSQEAVAASFLGFLKNFQETFDFKNKKIYIAGESYAGQYVPYMADAMFNTKDKTHFDVQGTMIYEYVFSDILTVAENWLKRSQWKHQQRPNHARNSRHEIRQGFR